MRYLRHRAVEVALNTLQESRGRHLFTQVMMGICDQSVVTINQRHEWQSLRWRVELQLLIEDDVEHK